MVVLQGILCQRRKDQSSLTEFRGTTKSNWLQWEEEGALEYDRVLGGEGGGNQVNFIVIQPNTTAPFPTPPPPAKNNDRSLTGHFVALKNSFKLIILSLECPAQAFTLSLYAMAN